MIIIFLSSSRRVDCCRGCLTKPFSLSAPEVNLDCSVVADWTSGVWSSEEMLLLQHRNPQGGGGSRKMESVQTRPLVLSSLTALHNIWLIHISMTCVCQCSRSLHSSWLLIRRKKQTWVSTGRQRELGREFSLHAAGQWAHLSHTEQTNPSTTKDSAGIPVMYCGLCNNAAPQWLCPPAVWSGKKAQWSPIFRLRYRTGLPNIKLLWHK